MPTIPNENPYTSATVFKKEVVFFTQDEISGQSILEGYNVNGPVNSTITAIPLPGGTKFVVPITSDSTSTGAPFLKFHFPNGTSNNRMYVTFAVKNSMMADGYYDYKTGIPNTYRSQLRNFIVSPISGAQFLALNGPKIKEIRFTAYGSSTNKPAEAVTFYITFKALYSPLTEATILPTDLAGPIDGTFPTPTPIGGGGGIQVTGFPGRT